MSDCCESYKRHKERSAGFNFAYPAVQAFALPIYRGSAMPNAHAYANKYNCKQTWTFAPQGRRPKHAPLGRGSKQTLLYRAVDAEVAKFGQPQIKRRSLNEFAGQSTTFCILCPSLALNQTESKGYQPFNAIQPSANKDTGKNRIGNIIFLSRNIFG